MDGGAQFRHLFLGSDYAGFTIDFYSAGTMTDKYVWNDETKASGIYQVRADSAGMASWYADGYYRMRVISAGGVLLYDWDNVKMTSDTATMWEGNFGLSYPTAATANRWQLFSKVTATNDFVELGINNGTSFVSLTKTKYASLNAAISDLGSNVVDVEISDEIPLTGNAVVPSTMRLVRVGNGTINQGTYTLTINGAIDAGDYRLFTGSGTVTNNGPTPTRVLWWVTSGSGTSADPWLFTNFEAPITAATTGISYRLVLWAQGYYRVTANTQIDVYAPHAFLHLKCEGDLACQIDSNTAIASMFSFANDTGYSHEFTMEGFHLDGNGVAGTNALLLIKHAYLVTLKNMNIDDGAGVGLKIHAGTGNFPMATGIEIYNPQIRGNDSHGIHIVKDSGATGGPGLFRIHGKGTIENNAGSGIYLENVNSGELTSLRFENNDDAQITIDNCYNINVFGNQGGGGAVASTGAYAVNVINGSFINSIYGNKIYHTDASQTAKYTLHFDNTTYENYYWNNGEYQGTSHSDMTTGSGNTSEPYSGQGYIKILDEGSNYNLSTESNLVATPENSPFYHSNKTIGLTGETYNGNQRLQNYLTYSDIFPQKTIAFTSGGTYVTAVGNTITGETSAATATVMKVIITSGSFAGGDAAGTLLLANQSGTFQAETIKVGANLDVASIAGDTSALGWIAQGAVTLTPDTSLILPMGYAGSATKVETTDRTTQWLYRDVAVNLMAGETMTFSVWAKAFVTTGNTAAMEMYIGTDTGTNGADPTTGTDFRKVIVDSKFVNAVSASTNNYPMQRHSLTWTAQANHTNVRIRVRPMYNVVAGGYVTISDTQLNKGKAAPYIKTGASAITVYPGLRTNRIMASGGSSLGFNNLGNVSGSVTINAYQGKYQKFTMTGNITALAFTSSGEAGDELVLEVTQDATGSRTISGVDASILMIGNAYTPTAAANAVDVLNFYYNGTNWIETTARATNVS